MGRFESFLGEKEEASSDVVLLSGCCNDQTVAAVSNLAIHSHIFLYNAGAGVWGK